MELVIKRDYYLKKLIAKRGNRLVKVITGIRRCGKSYLLFRLFHNYLIEQGTLNEHIIKIALDDDTQLIYRNPDELSKYVRSCIKDENIMYYVFIDELQYAITKDEMRNPENILIYNVLNGLMKLHNVDIYVTGSNSKMLSKDVMTVFRGRGDVIELFPLSFKEYYNALGSDMNNAYEEFALYGGMPQMLFLKTDEEKFKYIKNLFEEVYFKDITERYNIELPEILSQLTDTLCSSIGSLTNASKIARTIETVRKIKVDSQTISKYINYLMESFLFRCCLRYDVKGKKYFEYPSKFYCMDIGLRNVRLNLRQQEESHIMENIIFNELECRGYSVDVGVVELREKSSDEKQNRIYCEIDFIANKGPKKFYIQSALNIDGENKLKTEIRPLLNTSDFFKKIIITKTTAKKWIDDRGIYHIGIYEFLLDENSLDD